MQNTTVKTGRGWNWLWAAERSYGGEEGEEVLALVGALLGPEADNWTLLSRLSVF